MVADALRRKSSMMLAHIRIAYVPLLLDMKTLGISLDYDGYGALLASFMVRLTLVDQIRRNRCKMKSWSRKLIRS